METFELFQRFTVALAIGLMIGLERGWQSRTEGEGERAAGLRTLTLAAVLGATWGALAVAHPDGGLMALALAFSAFTAAITLFRFREVQHEGRYGATTVVAGMLSFALGGYAMLGDMQAAAAAGVAVTALLALKSVLHGWVNQLTWAELRSGLVLLAMTLIVLPILPNRQLGPDLPINVHEIWLLTVLIAAISFAGYVAIKILGARTGIVLSAIAGGLVSSTAVTLNMARLARNHPEQRSSLLGGALLAGATMSARILVVAGLINPAIAGRLAPAVAATGGVLLAAGLAMLARTKAPRGAANQITLKNPFELATVLQFGALLTGVTLLGNVLTSYAGRSGALALAAVSGLADVDAITLSMARLAEGALGRDTAALAIIIAMLVNTLAKAALGWVAGGREVGLRLALTAAASVVAGIVGATLVLA